MKKIGFVTSELDPKLIDDDILSIEHLNNLGISVEPVVWDKQGLLHFKGDALIFRSCWNYHRKYDEFQEWLKELEKSGLPVFNSLETLRWNLNKKHILELAPKISVPKTLCLEAKLSFGAGLLKQVLREWKAKQLVVKPAVSLNGHDTYLVGEDGLEKIELVMKELLESRDVLIQEFIPEIQTQGEMSLVFFHREFSHSVRKLPAKNEFRVHSEYGGKRESLMASERAKVYAKRVLDLVPGDLLYARVDLVETLQGPKLIEVEVTDPMLYLSSDEAAPEKFAKAVAQSLGIA